MTEENKERNEKVKADFLTGLRPAVIARKYGISRQRVYAICKDCSILPVLYSTNPREDVANLGIEIITIEQLKEL